MTIEIIRCPVCRKEYDADSNDLGTYQCSCSHTPPTSLGKPLDKVFETLMPFGKYSGTPFYKIPDSYLEWLETELLTAKDGKKASADLLEKLTAEIARRKKNPSARI